MPQFKSICPHCFMHYRLDMSYLGKLAQCSGCRKSFVLESINETMSFIPDLDANAAFDEENEFGKSSASSAPSQTSKVRKSPLRRDPDQSTLPSAKNTKNAKDATDTKENKNDQGNNNSSANVRSEPERIILQHSKYPSYKSSPNDITAPQVDAENVQTDSIGSSADTESLPQTPEGIWNVGDVVLGIYEVRPLAPGLPYAQGGVGIVQRIYHREWDMDLAMKSPKPGTFRSEVGISSYERECQTWIELGLHPNIVTCYLIRRIDNLPRIFAEFIPDGSLRDWIADERLYEGGPEVSLLRILDIAIQFAWGLDYAHQQGLLHLDVKPANVMMAGSTPKVTDFGLAQATTGIEQGAGTSKWEGMTPGYCSPEQYEAYINFRKKTKNPDVKMSLQSDIWSWAISVLSMFHGHAPCRKGGQTAAKVFEAFLTVPTTKKRPKMPTEMISIMRHCFQEDPKDRPQSMSDIAERLIDVYGKVSGSPYPRNVPSATRISAESLNNRAVSFLDLNKEKEARSLFHDALRIDPNHPETIYNQTLHLWRNVEITDQEAVERIDTLVKVRNDAVAYFAMGLIQRERGNIAPALLAFERAIEKKAIEKEERPDFQKALETAQMFAHESVRCTERLAFCNSNGPIAYINEKENLLLIALDSDRILFYDLKSYRKGFILKRSDSIPHHFSSEETDPVYEDEQSHSSETWTNQTFETSNPLDFPDDLFEPFPEALLELQSDFPELSEKSVFDETKDTKKNFGKFQRAHRCIAISEDFKWELFQNNSLRNLVLVHVGNLSERIEFSEISWGSTQLDLVGVLEQKNAKGDHFQQGHFEPSKNLYFKPQTNFSTKPGNVRLGDAVSENKEFGQFHSDSSSSDRENEENEADRENLENGEKRRFSSFAESKSSTKISFAQGLDTTHPHSSSDLAALISSSNFATDSVFDAKANASNFDVVSWNIHLCVDEQNDHEVQIIDQTQNVIVGTLRGHEQKVLSISHSGTKGEWIATGSKDRTIRLWEIPGCRCIRTLAPLDGSVDAVYLSRCGKYLFAIIGGNSFRIWEMELLCRNEEQLHAPILLCKVSSSEEVSRQQHEIATFQKGFADLMQREDYAGVAKLLTKMRNSSAWDMVRKEIPWDKLLQKCVREEPTETECVHTLVGHENKVACVALSIDGQLAVSAGNDQTIRMWNTETGKCVRVIEGHQDWIRDVAITWDGRYILSGSWDSTVRIWSAGSGRCVRLLDDRIRSISKVAFHPLGRITAIATAGGSLLLWNIVEDKIIGNWSAHRGCINSIFFSRDGRFLVSAGDDASVCVWDTFSQRLVRKLSLGKSPITAAKSMMGVRKIVVGEKDGTIEIRNVNSSLGVSEWGNSERNSERGAGRSLQTLTGHVAEISALEITVDNRFLLSASRDQTIKIWNLTDRTLQKTLSGHSGPITSMAVDFSGRKILSGSEDGTVRFWNQSWNLSFPGFQKWDERAKPILQMLLSLYSNESTGKSSPKLQPQSIQRILLEFGYRGFGWIRSEEVQMEIQKILDHWTGPPQL